VPERFVARVCSKGVGLPELSSSEAGGVPSMAMVGSWVKAPTAYSLVCVAHSVVDPSCVMNAPAAVSMGSSE
jgi:hypothetical protein